MTPPPRTGLAPVDPLADCPPGAYHDELVSVLRRAQADPSVPESHPIATTEHFQLESTERRIRLCHQLGPDELDNDLTSVLARELFAPGWLTGNDVFERVFTGLVLSTMDGPVSAWTRFYDNTLARIREHWNATGDDPAPPSEQDGMHSCIAELAPVYRRVVELTDSGSVLDLGSCFGFLPLLLAELGRGPVTATDLVPGTVRLVTRIAAARAVALGTLVCDAAWVPLPDESADTITAVHLLEHLDAAHGEAVLTEALRVARRRVVIAVPIEDEPNPVYGHVRVFDVDELNRIGQRQPHPFRVEEHHGGWLVIDKHAAGPTR